LSEIGLSEIRKLQVITVIESALALLQGLSDTGSSIDQRKLWGRDAEALEIESVF